MEQEYSYQKLMVRKRKRTGGRKMKKERKNLEEINEYKKDIAAVSDVIHWRITEFLSNICEGIDKTIWKINSAVVLIWCLLRA